MSPDVAASLIRRNGRKRQPGMVRHAVRLYERSNPADRDVRHHEAALAAMGKLGMWKEAVATYNEIWMGAGDGAGGGPRGDRGPGTVTDNMILSVIRACVRGSGGGAPVERREPLDVARDVVLNVESDHGIPMASPMVNPLAAGYQKIGLLDESRALLDLLTDRECMTSFHVDDVSAKDHASYALAVRSHVAEGDWVHAARSLREMGDAGAHATRGQWKDWSELGTSVSRKRGRAVPPEEDGVGLEGMGPDEVGPDRVGPDEVGPDGVGPNGAGRDDGSVNGDCASNMGPA